MGSYAKQALQKLVIFHALNIYWRLEEILDKQDRIFHLQSNYCF